MKFVTVSDDFFSLVSGDREILHKGSRRPHLLLIKLKYRGQVLDFAVPFRSNIPSAENKMHYFPLPPRSATHQSRRHGLHYIKMMPIDRKYLEKFWIGENDEYITYQKIVSKNIKRIVTECQKYLNEYEQNGRPNYAVDIDRIISILSSGF